MAVGSVDDHHERSQVGAACEKDFWRLAEVHFFLSASFPAPLLLQKFLLARGFCCAEAAQGAQPPCEGARLVSNKVETKFRPYRASYSSAVVVRMCVCVQCVEVNTCPSHRSPALRHPTPHPAHSHHRTHSFTSRGLLIDYTPATTHAHPPRTHTPAHTHTLTAASANGSGSRVYCYWRQVQRRDTREEQQSAECSIKADFCGAFLSSAVQPAERAQRAQHSLTAPGLPSEESITRRRGAEQCRK